MTEASSLALVGRAKVNLFLHVTGRRDDGRHELVSLIVRTGFGDRLRLAPAARDELVLGGPFARALGGGERRDNLAWRALEAARLRFGGPAGLRLELVKNIPVAAGLGGGSADAAAVLRGLPALTGAEPEAETLATLGAALGADVPACLWPGAVAVSGIGERCREAPLLPPCALVLVHAGTPLATAAVYAARRGAFGRPAPLDGPPADFDALVAALAARRNDLEPAAVGLAPCVAEVLERLRRLPQVRLARMSGSGGVCFGLVADLAAARRAAAALRRERPGWWVRATALA